MPFAWLDQFLERNALRIAVGLLLLFIALVVIVPYSVYAVRPGQAAVIWSRFGGGTITDKVYLEGTHTKWPWNIHYIYNVRTQTDTSEYSALSSDGVSIVAEVSFRYRVLVSEAGMLHKYVGPNFLEVLVKPEIGAALRTAISQFPTEALYSRQREAIQRLVVSTINTREAGMEVAGYRVVNMITLSDVLLRGVKLPTELQAAIDRKMVQYQVSQEYAYRIERERLEAERKRIEATGIRDFQQIVGANLTEPYLRWRGIDATLHLAEAPGSRLVIIGGRDGLPVILNPAGGPDALMPNQTVGAPADQPGSGSGSGPGIASPSTLPGAPLPSPLNGEPFSLPTSLPPDDTKPR